MADSDSRLELHFIILGQDAGGIIGKEGRNIRQMRDESSATINISGGSSVERILNIAGTNRQIKLATGMVAEKLQEMSGGNDDHVPPVTMRLLVPQSQCGPLIGKAGQRIKEIREASGTTITIPSESMPGSTERSVTLAGSPDSIKICISKICEVFEEFPPRQNNIQFYPGMQSVGSASQMMAMSGQMSFSGLSRRTQQRVTLPSNVIGSLIGKGGCHINEIRQFSGATVQVEEAKNTSRRSVITIGGSPEAVSCATFLINARISASRNASRGDYNKGGRRDNRDNRDSRDNRDNRDRDRRSRDNDY